MSRSLKVSPENIKQVKLALKRNRFPSQKALAVDVGLSLSTIRNFIKGKPVDYLNFVEICQKLALDWQMIAVLGNDDGNTVSPSVTATPEAKSTNPRHDWGEAPDVPVFFGRTAELAKLEKWIVHDHCRLIAILGMRGIGKTKLSLKLGKGGIGKTDLSLKLAQEIQDEFEYVIWRSLLNAPPATEILTDLIKFVSNQQEADLPDNVDGKISRLIHYLCQHRCLLILDNAEAILRGGARAGKYREGYEGYGELFRRVGEVPHKSCLMLTSREKLQEIALLEGKKRPVRSLELSGLEEGEGRKIFGEIACFYGSDDEWRELVAFYSGNPLALEIVAKHIQEVFLGNISKFLSEGKPVFYDINDLLDWHFSRLSSLEKELMYWLSINRESISVSDLKEDVLLLEAKEQVPATLQSLQRRLPIEKSTEGFTLQPVLIEYMTGKLIEQIHKEILTGELLLFNSHALIKATAKDYVRNNQVRLILKPLREKLIDTFKNEIELKNKLLVILENLQNNSPLKKTYIAGNIINIFINSKFYLKGHDFSRLTIWQAYLQGINLHDVNFAYSDLDKSVFTETLGGILSVAFSSNGQLIATGDANNNIYFWQVSDGKQLLLCKGHAMWVRSVAFSPDGNILASGSDDQTVKLWDVRTGECLGTLQGHISGVRSVVFSPDGYHLASVSLDQTVKLWDVRTGECLRTLQGHISGVRSVAFSPDGTILASGGDDKTIKLWNVCGGQCLNTLQGHTSGVRSVTFNPDGTILASGSDDKTIKLWSIRTGECLKTLQGHTDQLRSVTFSPDGQILASGSYDRTVRLWDVCLGECLKTLQGHINHVWFVAFSPDGHTLASGGFDQTMRVWEVKTGQCLRTWQGYSNGVKPVTFSPNGQILASGSDDHRVRVWDVQTGQCLKTLQGHTSLVWSVAFSPNGQILASSSDDHRVRVWDIQTGQCLKTLQGHRNAVESVAFSLDGQILVSGSLDQTIKLWHIQTGQCLKTLQEHNSRVWSVAFSPDGRTLASGSDDRTVRIWDICTGQCLRILQGHENLVRSITFSPDGRTLASSSDDRTVRIWDICTGQCLKILQGHISSVWSVSFNPDGSIIGSGSEDKTVRLWNLHTGQCLKILQGHTNWVWSVSFNPEGHTLASGSGDETINIWDIETSDCLKTLRPDRPYERMNITGVTGLTQAQKATLITLGAIV